MDVNQASGTTYATPAPAPPMPTPVSTPAPAPPERREEPRSEALLQRAVREVNASLGTYGRHLDIRHHEATNRVVVTVYDSRTNEVVREIPPQEVLDAHANMLEMVGIFVNTRG
ncbi:MAG: flagellar protein FlaG [Defluviitaleaceae bacterium]|nr:flagellar protein FlaG [Defluviitaleaceae bacterium]